jgi:transposase
VRTADIAPSLQALPALEALRRIWLQQDYRCTVPGREALRWRTGDEQLPSAVRLASPYDLEARYSSKRETHWVGYKVHLTETCDADHPDLVTQVLTTLATTQDSVMGPAIQQDLAERDLLPGTHLFDSGYVDADLLVTAQTPHQIDVVGPPFGSYSRQWREGKGYTSRPLSSIGRPSRRAVPKAIPVSTGGLGMTWRAIRSFASGLRGPPVARVPPAGSAPPPKQPRAS